MLPPSVMQPLNEKYLMLPVITSDEIAQARLWMEDWQRLVLKSHIFQIRLTEADFKSYILKRLTDETRANQARGGAP